MGTVIYSANSFRAFLPTFGTIAFMLLIAVVGLASVLLNRNQSRGARIGLGLAGGFLLIVGFVSAVFTVFTMLGGQKTVSVLLNNKREAIDNCDSGGGTCTRLVLETQANGGQNLYDFTVPQSAFDRTEIGQCYQVTYYPSTGLSPKFSESDSYVSTPNVTRIEQVDISACQ